ncbi:hypothetical protein ACEPPN_003129 [Leptodophora sp. 'Broadleaf-Isolate-01']
MASSTVQLTGIAGQSVELPTGLFINNEFLEAQSKSTVKVLNPSTGKLLAVVAAAEKQDVDLAVGTAKVAFDTWKTVSGIERRALLFKLAELIERDSEIFATIEALDAGVLFNDSKFLHVAAAVETLRYFAGWADKCNGSSMPISGGMAYTKKEPIGVCAAIVPWNSPLMITCWKLAPCIAAGNVLIVKTAELTPIYGLKLAQLVKEAGFPPGVINIITGLGAKAGQSLAEHMEVRKLAFTGSGPVGRGIMIAAARSNIKKVTLELGGKGPTLIFDDAELENAVFWATLGITAHNGQICAAGSRILVQSGIYDQFIEAFKKRSLDAVAGDPLLANSTKGPLASRVQRDKVLGHIQKGIQDGAELLHGGKVIESNGNYLENTAFVNVTRDMSLMRDEIFGPVAAIAKFKTEDEAISLANDSEYGLSSAIFTSDISRAYRVSDALETGQVTINSWGNINANTPFGGKKQSGFGKDLGVEGLDEWLNVKTVKVNLLPAKEVKV